MPDFRSQGQRSATKGRPRETVLVMRARRSMPDWGSLSSSPFQRCRVGQSCAHLCLWVDVPTGIVGNHSMAIVPLVVHAVCVCALCVRVCVLCSGPCGVAGLRLLAARLGFSFVRRSGSLERAVRSVPGGFRVRDYADLRLGRDRSRPSFAVRRRAGELGMCLRAPRHRVLGDCCETRFGAKIIVETNLSLQRPSALVVCCAFLAVLGPAPCPKPLCLPSMSALGALSPNFRESQKPCSSFGLCQLASSDVSIKQVSDSGSVSCFEVVGHATRSGG